MSHLSVAAEHISLLICCLFEFATSGPDSLRYLLATLIFENKPLSAFSFGDFRIPACVTMFSMAFFGNSGRLRDRYRATIASLPKPVHVPKNKLLMPPIFGSCFSERSNNRVGSSELYLPYLPADQPSWSINSSGVGIRNFIVLCVLIRTAQRSSLRSPRMKPPSFKGTGPETLPGLWRVNDFSADDQVSGGRSLQLILIF